MIKRKYVAQMKQSHQLVMGDMLNLTLTGDLRLWLLFPNHLIITDLFGTKIARYAGCRGDTVDFVLVASGTAELVMAEWDEQEDKDVDAAVFQKQEDRKEVPGGEDGQGAE